MAFKDYALVEMVALLDLDLKSPATFSCDIGKTDITPSRRHIAIPSPSFRLCSTEVLSPEKMLEMALEDPDIASAILPGQTTFMTGAQLADGKIILPAMFAAIGYATCFQGRTVKARLRTSTETTELPIERKQLEPFEDDLPEGVRKFCGLLRRQSRGAQNLGLFLTFNGVRLN